MSSPQTINKLFFILSIAALLIGFIRFGSFGIIDLSTMIFALFYFLFRIKTFLHDKHFFKTTDPATPRFQTVLFFEMLSWLLWILSGYFLNDYGTRISFALLSFAIAASTISMFMLPANKARNYRTTMNLIYFFIIMIVYANRDSTLTFLEWKILAGLNVILLIDFLISKRMTSK